MTLESLKQLPACFTILFQALRLYPPEHPQIKKHLEVSRATLTALLEEKKQLTLGLLDDTLLINDIPCIDSLPAARELGQLLEKQQLQALEILPGLDDRQLLAFCQQLPLCQGDDFAARLERCGVTSIRVLQPEEESPQATYRQALETVETICNDVRLGRLPSATNAIRSAKAMVKNILEQPYTLLSLAMLKNYDEYTFNHSVNVAVIAMSVGKACGLEQDQLYQLGLGGLFHDIGKMTITPQIVNKPGKLNPSEYAVIQQHPQNGAELVRKMDHIPASVIDIVCHHHLGHDHTGYPASDSHLPISPLTEMTSIADTYDAMTSIRCYQPPCSPRQAIELMKQRRGTYLNPEFLDCFIEYLGPYPVGTLVRLKAGSIALVYDQNRSRQGALSLKLIVDESGRRQSSPGLIELADSRTIAAEVDPMLNGIKLNDYLP